MALDLAADRFRPGSPLAEVGIPLGPVPQGVGDDRVDIIEMENREALCDFLWRSTVHERVDHRGKGGRVPATRMTPSPSVERGIGSAAVALINMTSGYQIVPDESGKGPEGQKRRATS